MNPVCRDYHVCLRRMDASAVGNFNVEGDLEARLKRVLIYFIGPGLFSVTVAAQGACAVSFYPPLLPERPASPVLPPFCL